VSSLWNVGCTTSALEMGGDDGCINGVFPMLLNHMPEMTK
jgi:hypothetical protein